MLRFLLVHSLERIASLYHFYILENDNIRCKSTEGKRVNQFGYMADRYFAALTISDGEETEEIKGLRDRLHDYIEVVKSDKNDSSVLYRLKQANVLKEKGYEMDVKKAALKYKQYADMPVIHGNNTLIMLITRFEEFMSNYLGQLYVMFPHKYLDNQPITFSELSSLNIDDVKRTIVDREIDAIMRDSYKEWFKIFESHKLSLQNYKEEMAVLDEIYARRNILVHNSGRVNNSYLAMVKDSDKKLGDVLYVDEAYLNTAFDAINVLMFAIIIESVKLVSTDKKEYLQDVFSQTFEHLCEGRYYLCSRVYKALMESKYLDANHKTMSTVNYWISKIEMDGIDSVRPEIECFDVSALNTLFALAKDVLLEKYDAAKSLTSYLYKTGEITANMLETWPLFMHFRATTQYTEFKNEHAEDFKVATFEVNIENGRENEEVSIISEGVDAGNCMPEGINEIAAEKEAVVL